MVLFICLPKFGSHFKSCHFAGLSQNLAAKILANYFGNLFWHAKLWQLFCHKKVAISKSCHLGGLRKIFAAKILATFLSWKKLPFWKVAIWRDLEKFLLPEFANFFSHDRILKNFQNSVREQQIPRYRRTAPGWPDTSKETQEYECLTARLTKRLKMTDSETMYQEN